MTTRIAHWWRPFTAFLRSEDGPTAVEYAILLALLILVSVTAISTAGGMMSVCYENISDAVAVTGF